MFVGCNLNVSKHRHVEIAQKGCQCIYQYVRPTDVANFTYRIFGFLFNVVKIQAKKNVPPKTITEKCCPFFQHTIFGFLFNVFKIQAKKNVPPKNITEKSCPFFQHTIHYVILTLRTK